MNHVPLLKVMRIVCGLRQAEAAARLGISRTYLSRLENGAKATPRVLGEASRLYGVPVETLTACEKERNHDARGKRVKRRSPD